MKTADVPASFILGCIAILLANPVRANSIQIQGLSPNPIQPGQTLTLSLSESNGGASPAWFGCPLTLTPAGGGQALLSMTVNAPPVQWKVVIPATAPMGSYTLQWQCPSGASSPSVSLTVSAQPNIQQWGPLEPAPSGSFQYIQGSWFGNTPGVIRFQSQQNPQNSFTISTTITSWTNNAINYALPLASPGPYWMTVQTASNGNSPPVPYQITPSIQHIWVADSWNNRVLRFPVPTKPDEGADLVIGPTLQVPLVHPRGVTPDPFHDRLWIVDTGNSRVLEMTETNNVIGLLTTVQAVVGQQFFCPMYPPPPTSTSLCNPTAAALDSHDNLWIADTGNNRVLEFVPPYTQGASVVIGQPNFTSNQWGNATTTTPPKTTFLDNPTSLAFDLDGNLWVADMINNRVLEFAPPFKTGQAAIFDLGQKGNLSGNAFNLGDTMTDPNGLANPFAVAVDAADDLWVADENNTRVLEFIPTGSPRTFSQFPNVVIGQHGPSSGDLFNGDPCTDSSITTQGGLCQPQSLFLDGSNDLWVVDTVDNRVLEYVPVNLTTSPPTFDTGQLASLELGQLGFSEKGSGSGGVATLDLPTGGGWAIFRQP